VRAKFLKLLQVRGGFNFCGAGADTKFQPALDSREPCIQNYRPHAIVPCMTFWNSTTLVMHTWAYKRNEKVHFNCIWTSGEAARSLFAAQYFYRSCFWMSLSSGSSVSSTAPRHLHWLTDFRFLPPMRQSWSNCAFCTLSLKRHTNSFAVVENISMWFCISLTHR